LSVEELGSKEVFGEFHDGYAFSCEWRMRLRAKTGSPASPARSGTPARTQAQRRGPRPRPKHGCDGTDLWTTGDLCGRGVRRGVGGVPVRWQPGRTGRAYELRTSTQGSRGVEPDSPQRHD